MEIKKGQKVIVRHNRSGTWNGIAKEDFDTNKDEWYPISLDQEFVEGLNTVWHKGDNMPARRGLCEVSKR